MYKILVINILHKKAIKIIFAQRIFLTQTTQIMRHGNKLKSLNRTDTHRKAMLANMTCSLIQHKRIETTTTRAKALRVYAEPLLNRSKEENNTTADQTMHQRRTVMAYLKDKEALKELFGVVGPKLGTRPGGYTRVIKLGQRQGDSAEMAIIELVDFNDVYSNNKKTAGAETKKKTTRRGKKKAEDTKTEGTTEETKTEE